MANDIILHRAEQSLKEIFDKVNIDRSHGIEHAKEVEGHVKKAITYSRVRNKDKQLVLRLAGLLHDADDRKFFPKNKEFENAKLVLNIVLPSKPELHSEVIKLINYVSFSKNGNGLFLEKDIPEEDLFPCLADRIEALGKRGIITCYQYTVYKKRPLFNEKTKKCKSIEQIKKVSTNERLIKYLDVKDSETMIDHFYDKLCHLYRVNVSNPYLRSKLEEGSKEINNFLIDFGKRGTLSRGHINKIISDMEEPVKM